MIISEFCFISGGKVLRQDSLTTPGLRYEIREQLRNNVQTRLVKGYWGVAKHPFMYSDLVRHTGSSQPNDVLF